MLRIREAMIFTNGNKYRAAHLLGMDRRLLYRYLKTDEKLMEGEHGRDTTGST